MKILLIILSVLFLAIIPALWLLSGSDSERMRFVEVMNQIANNELDFMPDKIILSTNPGTARFGRNVIVNDPIAIEILLKSLQKGKLSDTRQYIFGPDHFAPKDIGSRIRLTIFDKSEKITGFLHIGGVTTDGIGFMVEHYDDIPAFHGAWDPYPVRSYWFPVFPVEWIENPPQDNSKKILYEMFAYLFLLTDNYNKTEFHFTENGRSLVLLEKENGHNLAQDLVNSNSVREFLLRNPTEMPIFLNFDTVVEFEK